jgi:hypothetical protein
VTDGQDPPLPVPGTQSPEPERGYQGGAEFHMDFAAVQGLSKMLDQAGEYCTDTERFIEKHRQIEDGGDLFRGLHSKHDAVVEQAVSWFKKAADPVMATTASKIDASVQRFKDTETENAAAAIDAGVPTRIDTVDVSLPPWDKTQTPIENTDVGRHAPYGPFEFIDDPADALREPRDYANDPELKPKPEIYETVASGSPTGNARSIIIRVTEFMASMGWLDRSYDPLEVFLDPVVGDWAGLRQFADVLRYAGDAAERTGIGIDRARHMLGPVWQGRSADACVVWLGAVAKPMREAPNALDAMAAEYERAVDGAVAFRTLLADVLESVIDACFFIAGALLIGGGGAAATGGLSLAGAALVAGAEIITVANGINTLRKAMGNAKAVVAAVEATMKDFGNLQAGGHQLPNLPTVSGPASALSVLPA